MLRGPERLEPRDCPAVDAGLGSVWLAPGVVRHCFEDSWSGPLNVYDAGDKVYVGAGAGGGPRVEVFDRPGALLRDFFAGDPGSRAGVVFVPADPPPPALAVAVPMDAGDPAAFPVLLRFDAGRDADWQRAAFAAAARLLLPAGLRLTTVRPDLPAGDYGEALVGAPLSFAGAGTLGLTPFVGAWVGRPGGPYSPLAVYVGGGLDDPAAVGVAAAHEVGHALGLGHRPGPTVMSPTFPGPDAEWDPSDLAAARGAAAQLAQRMT